MNSDHLSLYFDMLSGKDIKKLERINYLKNLVKWAEQENENIRIDLRPVSPRYTYELRVYGSGYCQGCEINVNVSEDTYEKIESAFNEFMSKFNYGLLNHNLSLFKHECEMVNIKFTHQLTNETVFVKLERGDYIISKELDELSLFKSQPDLIINKYISDFKIYCDRIDSIDIPFLKVNFKI